MNSDKFDRIVLDLLYGELDELTTAAARRHMDQSARARDIFAHFKATRQLSVLPTHAPPPDFEVALMERERRALAELPLHLRVGRLVSMLAGYAMRPQLIMGALLLLMIGSSLMFLRARPGQHSAVQVTERGAPEAEAEALPAVVEPSDAPDEPSSAPSWAATAADLAGATGAVGVTASAGGAPPGLPIPAAEGLDPFDQALALYRDGHYLDAQRSFERIMRSGGRRAAEAGLYAAQSLRSASGCAPAVGRFERVRLDFPGSSWAYEAAWRGAKCLQQLGDIEGARQSYESLLQVGSHATRARAALAALGTGAAPLPRATREPATARK